MAGSYRFELENVRCLAACALEVPAGKMTTVIGVNNAGKSTLLEMMARCVWSIPGAGGDMGRAFPSPWYRRLDRTYQRPKASIDLPLADALIDNSDLVVAGDVLHVDFSGSLVTTRVSAHLEAYLVPTSAELIAGSDRRTLLSADSSWTEHADLWNTPLFSLDHHLTSQVHRSPLEVSGRSNLQGKYNGSNMDQETPFARAIGALRQRTFHFPANRSPTFDADAKDQILAQGSRFSVTSLLKRLDHDRTRFDTFRTAVTQVFDEITDVALRDQNGELAPFAMLGSEEMPISAMGFGFRNAVHLLAVLCSASRGTILFIDEPELGLNQSKQADLAVALQTLRDGEVTTVVATQAEAFCRGLDAASPLALLKSDRGSARTTMLDIRVKEEDRLALARAMGIDPLYVASGGKIVFVEGTSDERIVDRWMGLNGLKRASVIVESLGGCGTIHMEFAKTIFAQFRDRVFFLLDSDRPVLATGSVRGRIVQEFAANKA